MILNKTAKKMAKTIVEIYKTEFEKNKLLEIFKTSRTSFCKLLKRKELSNGCIYKISYELSELDHLMVFTNNTVIVVAL